MAAYDLAGVWYLYVSVCRSPVAVDGRISVGDVIVEVNAVSLESMSDETAVNALRDAVRNAKSSITHFSLAVFTARCTAVQSAVLLSHVVCPSICL